MKNVIVTTIHRIINILNRYSIRKSVWLTFGIFINSLFEIIGLAAILPVLAAILKPQFIHENKYSQYAFEYLGFQNDNAFVVVLCIFIFLFILFKNFFGIWVQKKQAEFSWDLHEYLSTQVFQQTFNRGFLFFSQNNSNKILNRVFGVPLQFAQQMLLFMFQFMNESIILTLILSSLLIYDYKILLLLASIVLPVFLIFYTLNKQKITNHGLKLNELGPQISKPVFEVVFGYVDVVINGTFNSFMNTYSEKIKEAKTMRIGMLVIQNIPNRLIEICVVLAVMIMLLYGLFQLKETDKILTLMSIFGLAAYRTIPSINRLMLAVVNIKNHQFTLDYLEEYLAKNTEDVTETPSLNFKNEIKIDHLTFGYPDGSKPILNEISFEIKKGESIGVIGKSGTGKTTLINLLLGFFHPTKGSIKIDGVVLSDSNVKSWQNKCGYVRQDVFLIDGSLEQNIAFGISNKNIDPQKLKLVIEQSQLSDLVSTLPEGTKTNIGERGSKLSGGQRQRVGIARALYHDAEILFFDEATSALDSETEEEITQSICQLQKEKLTMVIIAHRESTLKHCNKLIRTSNNSQVR